MFFKVPTLLEDAVKAAICEEMKMGGVLSKIATRDKLHLRVAVWNYHRPDLSPRSMVIKLPPSIQQDTLVLVKLFEADVDSSQSWEVSKQDYLKKNPPKKSRGCNIVDTEDHVLSYDEIRTILAPSSDVLWELSNHLFSGDYQKNFWYRQVIDGIFGGVTF